MGNNYREQYFDQYYNYMKERCDKERKEQGKKPLKDSTIYTNATDTFFLEKREDRDFGEWLVDEDSLKEAEMRLRHYLANRKKPENDLKNYMADMRMFKDFLEEIKH